MPRSRTTGEKPADKKARIVHQTLERVRLKLLDLSRRNNLLNFRETRRTIRIIDELLDQTFRMLVSDGKLLEFLPLDPRQIEASARDTEKENPAQYSLPVGPPPNYTTGGTSPSKDVKGKKSQSQSEENINEDHELPYQSSDPLPKHTDTRLQTPLLPTPLEQRCKNLTRYWRTGIEEAGINYLYLALGFLEWYESDNSDVMSRAPLILVPLRIERTRLNTKTNCYGYVISYSGEDIETNLSLVEKLNFDFNLILPEIKEELSPEKYFADVKRVVENQKRWRVAREMIVGFFSFAKLRLYKDLDDKSWPSTRGLTAHQTVNDILIGREKEGSDNPPTYKEEYDVDRNLALDRIPLVLDADSSQHSAIIDAVMNGKNLVIEGPPGTGKSQSITNMIAAATHSGKTVLFVSEKKAALEVVRKRMDAIGLGDFCLELHSHKTQKGQLHADLAIRLNRKYQDAAVLDQEIDEFRKERARLQSYYDLLNTNVGSNQQTVYDILWGADRWSAQLGHKPMRFFIDSALQLSLSQIRDTASALADFCRIHGELPQNVTQAWKGFEPKLLLPGDENDILDSLLETERATASFSKDLESISVKCKEAELDLSLKSLRDVGKLDTKILEGIPQDFDEELGSSLLDKEALKALSDLEDEIKQERALRDKSSGILGDLNNWSAGDLQTMENGIVGLEPYGYIDHSPSQLKYLKETTSRAIETIDALWAATKPLSRWLHRSPEVVSDFQKVLNTYKILTQAPSHASVHAYSPHALRYTASQFDKAHGEHSELSKNLANLTPHFDFDKAPKTNEILTISEEIRRYGKWWKRILSQEFRRVRKTLQAFVKDKKCLSKKDLPDSLNKLATTIQQIDEYDHNANFRKVLGPLFRGMHTDWETLGALVSWSQTLIETMGSEDNAQDILSDFTKNRENFGNACKKIVGSWDILKKDLSTLHISVKSVDRLDRIRGDILERQQAINALLGILPKSSQLSDVPMRSIKEAARSGSALLALSCKIESDHRFPKYLGRWYRGFDTDVKSLRLIADWLNCLLSDGCYKDRLVCWLVSKDTRSRLSLLEEFIDSCNDYFTALDRFASDLSARGQFSLDDWIGDSAGTASTDIIGNRIKESSATSKHLILYSDYCNSKRTMSELGLGYIAEAIENGSLAKQEAPSQFYYSVYRSMANELMRKYPVLANFNRATYDNVRDRMKKLDISIQHRARNRIAFTLSKRDVPTGVSTGFVSQYTERSLIEHELSKKKRHIPIRQLVQRASNALQALKPCFMMSPQSVAQYLDPRGALFDLVVMDEASQLRLEDALGAVARGHQAVIVGDPKQLPPTMFFERLLEGEHEIDDITAAEEAESILDICQTCFENRRLRWHYRSEHEQLIAFSNSEFYDNDLIIFPAPFGIRADYGVKYHYVENALYQKGKNRVEAGVVAAAIMDHFRKNPMLSLGVATFNIEQRDLIQDELERLQKRNSWLEQKIKKSDETEEPFFVKNLENVQGDERDVIFISTTYGPDAETRQVYQRFGPINLPMGWRRLNVLVTRARKRLELFTSMKASDVHLVTGASRGVVALRKYLEYAERGTIPDFGDINRRKIADSDFEIAVSKVLNQNGFKTCFQVGVAGFFIDIAVYHPLRQEEFILGVECDGATYHSAKSIRDRDLLRQRILEGKGWRIHRIWSTDWFKNREKETDSLIKKLRTLVDADRIKAKAFEPRGVEKPKEEPRAKDKEKVSEESMLRKALTEFRERRIGPSSKDVSGSILADDILEEFIERKPTTKEEFHQFPYEIRSRVSPAQGRHLDEILDLIENICG